MNDPHVEALNYHFVSLDERHDFTAATPREGCLGNFECHLEAGQLEAVPGQNLTSEAAARSMLEPHLRSRELRAELEEDSESASILSPAEQWTVNPLGDLSL